MFDRFARLAARVADTPTALVSVVTDDRQYFAGLCGVGQPWADARQTPLSHSFCQHVVTNAAPLVVDDAREDPVLCTNLAIVDLDVIAYAGFPIVGPTGHVLGSLCAIDSKPRVWQLAQLESLADVALLVGNELERRDLVRRLSIDARTDALTGMANRRAWEEELPSALRRAERLGHSLSVVLIDIDHFKDFNDRHGHPAGDAALREIGVRWRSQTRDIDLLARIGGEEFGLLLPGWSPESAVESVDRLRASLPGGLTASAGVVAWALPLTPEQFIAEADRALYRAKADGRDRAHLASGQTQADAR
ncbi:MAG: sensor domain-containing diguanylate cyclase, partial [Solirubrobacteraceae bacterium]